MSQSYLVVVMDKDTGHVKKAVATESKEEALETAEGYDNQGFNVGVFPCDRFEGFTKHSKTEKEKHLEQRD